MEEQQARKKTGMGEQTSGIASLRPAPEFVDSLEDLVVDRYLEPPQFGIHEALLDLDERVRTDHAVGRRLSLDHLLRGERDLAESAPKEPSVPRGRLAKPLAYITEDQALLETGRSRLSVDRCLDTAGAFQRVQDGIL